MACFGNLSFGPYSATYGGTNLGLIEQAWFLESQAEVRDIRAARYGETIIGGIYLGQNAFIITRLKEWTAIVRAAIHPWAGGAGGIDEMGRTGDHGACVESLAQELVLTALQGTPAGGVGAGVAPNRNQVDPIGPTTITCYKAIYAPRHNLQIPFGNLERDVHIVFQLYPIADDSSNYETGLKHFEMA